MTLSDRIKALPAIKDEAGAECVSREAVLGMVAGDDNALRASLREIMKLIEDGFLVRNISRDGEPGWAMRQIPMVQTLAKAAKLMEPNS